MIDNLKNLVICLIDKNTVKRIVGSMVGGLEMEIAELDEIG